MQLIKKAGVALAYEGINPSSSPILFVHGWGCDHSVFAPQVEFFRRRHHVVSVDLRGHGKSDAPEQDYTMAGFADDLAWLCTELGLTKPLVIGHSMGGNVALKFAARYPGIPRSIVLIDSVILPPQSFLDAMEPLAKALQGPNYRAAYRQTLLAICSMTEDETQKEELVGTLPKAPQHVLVSAFKNHVTDYDATPAATGCHVPVGYIGAAVSLADLIQFRSLTPHLLTAQTLGSGHFSPLFVPDQINAMLSTFVEISLLPSKVARPTGRVEHPAPGVVANNG
jgi:pimeloyl-ACP methyl ester carboxylesterase